MKNGRVIFTGLACLWLLAGCHRNAFPAIKNEKTLQQDCMTLLEKFPEGEIAKDQWPRTVAALKPLKVEREGESIRIWTHQETGQYANGYYVFKDWGMSPPSKGVWIKKTQFPGIYRFETYW
jgi:hypothetical protein